MMISLLLAVAALAAEPTAVDAQPTREELLRTFRDEFIVITPGEQGYPAQFTMGAADGLAAEKPPHQVRLRRPFAIARYEVPQNLWQAVTGENPSRWKGARNSVEMLSFADAQAFCRKATELMRAGRWIGPKQSIRLPTEAEWEYSARAGATTRYSFGDDPRDLAAHGWYAGNAAGNDPAVGVKRPNPWNLHDAHGYLWEWCADRWHDDYRDAPQDGSVWSTGGDPQQRVLRGGSWKDPAESCTSSFRRAGQVDLKDDAIGLRHPWQPLIRARPLMMSRAYAR